MDEKDCPTCHGEKKTTTPNGQRVTCGTCHGKGKVPDRGSLDNPKG